MDVIFLGTGTSTGVPEIGCHCSVCTSSDFRDRRMRTSVLVTIDSRNILLDCGPDFRWQMLSYGPDHLDAVLISHEHYDHVGGLDDLRPFCRQHDINLYAESNVVKAIHTRLPYVFCTNRYPGVPKLNLHEITINPFEVVGICIIPIRVMHGKLPILGYRIGNMAYLTDVKSIPDSEYEKLKDLDLLIITALRHELHPTHQCLSEALDTIQRIKPKETYLIHMGHSIGLHNEIERTLPEHVHLSYDGLKLTI